MPGASVQIDLPASKGKSDGGERVSQARASHALTAVGKKLGTVALAAQQRSAIVTEGASQRVHGLVGMGAVVFKQKELPAVFGKYQRASFERYTLTAVVGHRQQHRAHFGVVHGYKVCW